MDLVSKRYWYFLLSLLVIVPGAVSLIIPPSLKPGIEFTGGTAMTIKFEGAVEQGALRQTLAPLGHQDAVIQRTGEGNFLLRTRALEAEQKDPQGKVIQPDQRQELEKGLREAFGPLTVLDFSYVSPVVAAETVVYTGLAVLAAVVGMLIYITLAFRHLPNPFRYGVCAVVAMIHDTLVVLGIFSIMGKLLGTQVDLMFIAAVLTVIGYSINDTIVIFDRIRENLGRGLGHSFAVTVNNSLMEVLSRSLNTGLSAIFVLLAIYLLGGVTVRDFVLVLIIGIVSGTYSSIFNAAQLLVAWENRDIARFFQRRALGRAAGS